MVWKLRKKFQVIIDGMVDSKIVLRIKVDKELKVRILSE